MILRGLSREFLSLLCKFLHNKDKALAEGKWKNTYTATNIWEYWAEGVQNWFNVNAEVPEPDGKHNFVNSRSELKEYDTGLYAILADYFPETIETVSCHCQPSIY